jgi:hypothetical protein
MINLEEAINPYGQKQFIKTDDRIIKIDNKFLQVRLIRTQKWKKRSELTKPMPRAKFVNPTDLSDPYYIIRKSDLKKLKETKNDRE